MTKDTLDNQLDGQMTIADLFTPPDRLIAVSKIFAKARRAMSLAEQKTFVYALSQFRFTEEAQSTYVKLDKKVLANILGINSDPDHLSVDLYEEIKDLPRNSFIHFEDKVLDFCTDGFVISSMARFKNVIRLHFNSEYMPLFTNLSSNYITLWSSDIFQMTSKRSVQFYEYLRQVTDTREKVNNVGLGVRFLKEMFGIPKEGKGSYMRKDGHFDRPAFEKYVIDPLCDDLRECRMIQLVVQPDGKYYEKVKRGNRVDGYRFYWAFNSHPAIADAGTAKEIQDQVDEDPKDLKTAKDFEIGKKRKKKTGPEGTRFNDFNQRAYDYSALEEKLRKGK